MACQQKSSSSLLTLPLDSPWINLSNAGGKGNNLSILSRYNGGGDGSGSIRVPPGFVITTAAYEVFMNQDNGSLLREIGNEIAKLTSRAVEDDTNNNISTTTQRVLSAVDLESTSNTIRTSFHKHSLPSSLESEIEERMTNLFPNSKQQQQNPHKQKYFAIRSSATCEDAPDASFAGQHDTYLNVPRNEVCERVVDCFASLFTSRAISYRYEQQQKQEQEQMSSKLSDIHPASMAVVVQEMATPTQYSSGVLFTANPLTGRRNESVLEAIPGLGEALVSGLTEPDRYVVKKRQNNDGADVEGTRVEMNILDRRIGSKAKAIHAVEGGGVKEETTIQSATTYNDSTAVLSDEQVKQIIQIGQQIEALFNGKPQDIEWALSEEGEIYIVQSRPITTLFPLPNVPLDPLKVFFSFNASEYYVFVFLL